MYLLSVRDSYQSGELRLSMKDREAVSVILELFQWGRLVWAERRITVVQFSTRDFAF